MNINKRELLTGALMASAVAVGPSIARGALAAKRSARTTDGPIIVNALGELHNPNIIHAGQPAALPDATTPVVDDRVIRDALASGVTAVNITLGYVSGPMEPFEYTIKSIAAWDRILRDRSDTMLKVNTADDILRAKEQGKIGVIYGFQNLAQVGDSLDRIDIFGNLGVSVMQLTYNPANQIGDGSMAPLNRGLTPFGREVVARLNARRVMVDLSHSGERTCLDTIAVSTRPISINHTGCRALVDLPRNKTDAELRGVADKGGFVGIYFMPYLNLSGHAHADDVVAHIEHAVNVCGEDHVGIGTDGGTTQVDDMDAYKAFLAAWIAARTKAGIGATGERADTFPFAIDLRGVEEFRKLAMLLKSKGYSTGRIEKILGRNFVAFAREIWG